MSRDAGNGEEAIALFLREYVRLPEPAIEQTRTSPAFPALVRIAQSTIYGTELVDSVSTPTADAPSGSADDHPPRRTDNAAVGLRD